MLTGKLTLAFACSFVAAVAIPSALADGNGVRQRLLANAGFVDCSQGATAGTQLDNSFVTLKVAKSHVRAKIQLRGALPNGEWGILLAQTPLEGCPAIFEGFITTNGHGNGKAEVKEPIDPGNTGAFVLLTPLNTAALPDGFISNVGTVF